MSSSFASSSSSRPCVLLVDDDAETAFVVGLLCRRGGQDFTRAADVPTALSWLAGNRWALILLDINLAGASGLDLLAALPDRATRPPVALFCQSGLWTDLAAGWNAGADFWMPKDLIGRPADWA